MRKTKKLLLFIIIFLLNTVFSGRNNNLVAGLRDFKQDFVKTIPENPDAQNSPPKEETKNTATQTNIAVQGVQPDNAAQIIMAQAAADSTLNNFYNDFKPPEKKPDNSNTSTNQNSYNNYYQDYSLDYYRYNYPYYYPYNNFYPNGASAMYGMNGNTVIAESEYTKNLQSLSTQREEPERHTWYNTSLDYQTVSKDLTAIGMVFGLVSAGKVDEISYGFKFDYTLFTEKNGADHYSLPLYDVGLTLGKQMGYGLVESFIAYSKLGDLSGLSLKLSTDQWIQKYVFITGGVGVSIINDSPLTDTNAGIGIGNSMLQFIIGYRSPSSVNYTLDGPQFKIRVIL